MSGFAVPSVPATPAVPVVPFHWTFPAEPGSVRRARRAVTEALPAASAPQLVDDLALLTSELVTNAVRYGARPADDHVVELVLWPVDGHYWLAVSDPGDGVPVLATPDPDARGGRGMVLVDALSAAWALVPRAPRGARGKCVVAGVRMPVVSPRQADRVIPSSP
jgi:anti-sigma regulatory factor (Ser/Thr protein kinase)